MSSSLILLLLLATAAAIISTADRPPSDNDGAPRWWRHHQQCSSAQETRHTIARECLEDHTTPNVDAAISSPVLDDSETTKNNHRLLSLSPGRDRYISYRALAANRIPCGKHGSSYYDCSGHKKANPYTRGCTAITRCYRYTNTLLDRGQ